MELCSTIAGGSPWSILESSLLKGQHCVTADVSFIYIDCRISYTCCQHKYVEARQYVHRVGSNAFLSRPYLFLIIS